MLRYGRLRHAGIASQCVDCLFALPGQLLENGPARRIGKSPEHVICIGRCHRKTITIWLCFVKGKVTIFQWRPSGESTPLFARASWKILTLAVVARKRGHFPCFYFGPL